MLAFWMVGPSAIGSVKGRPSSITSGALGQRCVCMILLDNALTCTSSLHSQHHVDGLLSRWESSGDISHKSSLQSSDRSAICAHVVGFPLQLHRMWRCAWGGWRHTLPSFLHCAKVFLIPSMLGVFEKTPRNQCEVVLSLTAVQKLLGDSTSESQ